MPNWCRNKIIVGNKAKMDELVKAHCRIDKDTGFPEMDFNTIKKMPDELNIEYGTKSDDGIALYLARKNPACDFYGSKADKMTEKGYAAFLAKIEDSWSLSMSADKPMDNDRLAKMKEKYKGCGLGSVEKLGKTCIDNFFKYGAMNGYEWSVANWGTKWNACDTNVSGSEMTFDTAWDPAIPAMVAMSALHKDMPIAMLFADEQTGAHTGYVLMKNGKIDDSGSFREFSVDAYKLAFNVWGNEDEYIYDTDKKTYVRKELQED